MKHWHILESDDQLKKVFSERPLVVYKRGRNLETSLSILICFLILLCLKPRLLQFQMGIGAVVTVPNAITYKCFIFISFPVCGCLKLQGIISCSTKYVIYLITCPCGKSYVGKTSRPRSLKTRIAEHRSTIRCRNLNTQ